MEKGYGLSIFINNLALPNKLFKCPCVWRTEAEANVGIGCVKCSNITCSGFDLCRVIDGKIFSAAFKHKEAIVTKLLEGALNLI